MHIADLRPARPSLRAFPSAVVTALLLAFLVIPGPTAAGTPTPLGASIGFSGRGWGHGVGLSQYGARGRALAGQTAPDILAHYFAGTTIGTTDPAQPVRVRVLSGFAATETAPLVIVGKAGPWTVDGIGGSLPAEARLSVRPPLAGTTAWRLTVTDSVGAPVASATASGPFRVAPASDAGHLELKSKPSYYDEFRGTLTVRPGTTTVAVVNTLGLDAYLRGVVPIEMRYTWPTEALRAQTIAARSYAAIHLHPSSGTFDVYDDSRSQVYRGLLAERASTSAAVTATAGQVLLSGTAIANALFHSTGGCATENNEAAFVSSTGARITSPIAYLRGSADTDPAGACYDAASPYFGWSTKSYSLATVSAWFAADSRTNVGTLTGLDLSNRGVSGRLISVTLVGSAGTRTVSGGVFRAVFNAHRPGADPSLRSTLFFLLPTP